MPPGSLDGVTPTKTDAYTYGDSNWKDKLTAYSGSTITYDAIGNPLQYHNGSTFTWKDGCRLATATKADGTAVSYKYNEGGNRTQKTIDGVNTMNKKIIIVIGSVSIALLLISVSIRFLLVPVLELGSAQRNISETFLESSVSPDGKYKLEAYRTEPGATVDFSIKVYLIIKSDKKTIYNAYHENSVDIDWISDNQVSINSRILDLSKNETFDWRKN